jgi:hypothetical protein
VAVRQQVAVVREVIAQVAAVRSVMMIAQ